MQERPSRIVVAILVAVATLHAALFVFGLFEAEAIVQFDRAAYRLGAAQALADAKDASELQAVFSRYTPVGDYAWHGVVLWIARGWSGALVLVQLGLLALSLRALFRIVRELEFSSETAWAAVCLYALLPIDVMVPHFVASEAFFNPLLVWGTFFVVRYAKRSGATRDLFGAGITFSAALMTRSEILPWLPVLICFVIWIVRRRQQRWQLARHLGVFVACLLVLPGSWFAYRNFASASPRLAEGELSINAEIARRAARIESAAHTTGEPVTTGAPLRDYAHVVVAHPRAFAKEWVLQAVKLLALPDNLDMFRYLGALEFTGKRAELIHTQGFAGAFRTLFREMPLLMSVLVLGIMLFGAFWILVLRGVVDVARLPGMTRLLSFLLLSLPVVYVLLRAVSQGESRKRSPVDFALVIFAAVGWAAWHRAKSP